LGRGPETHQYLRVQGHKRPTLQQDDPHPHELASLTLGDCLSSQRLLVENSSSLLSFMDNSFIASSSLKSNGSSSPYPCEWHTYCPLLSSLEKRSKAAVLKSPSTSDGDIQKAAGSKSPSSLDNDVEIVDSEILVMVKLFKGPGLFDKKRFYGHSVTQTQLVHAFGEDHFVWRKFPPLWTELYEDHIQVQGVQVLCLAVANINLKAAERWYKYIFKGIS
jgi:hypothetical protein